MTRQDALRMLEETIDLKPNTLTGHEALGDLAGWDSMSTMAFIATVDKAVGLPLRGNQVVRCQTVAELLDLVVPQSRAA